MTRSTGGRPAVQTPSPPRGRRRRRAPVVVAAAAAALAAVVTGVVVWAHRSSTTAPPTGPPCRATAGGAVYGLDTEQAAVATTVAGVGKRLGMPDHAVTVALATALQESGLRNLDHGDRDSLGVFQQRPSQGWGTPGQIKTPRLAAAAFYNRLVKVSGWETLPVTEAAQAVQRSGAASAYAQWEPEARVLAQALTGEVPAAFGCRASVGKPAAPGAALAGAMTVELGPPGLEATVPAARGWTVAAWLVARAATFGLASVSFSGSRWTAKSGTWSPAPAAGLQVRVNV
jgi:hypothetical protein